VKNFLTHIAMTPKMIPPGTPMASPWDLGVTHTNPLGASDHDLDLIEHLRVFIRDQIVMRHDGKMRDPRSIACRLIVFQILLDPGIAPSLASVARRFTVSRERLSRIAREFGTSFGLRCARTNGDRSHLRAGTPLTLGTAQQASNHSGRWCDVQGVPGSGNRPQPGPITTQLAAMGARMAGTAITPTKPTKAASAAGSGTRGATGAITQGEKLRAAPKNQSAKKSPSATRWHKESTTDRAKRR